MTETRILIVENEVFVAKSMSDNLDYFGYTVVGIAPSGEEAIQKAGETRPHLVLMDIRLDGEMDGIEAARQIWSQFEIPIVYLTALADEETLQQAKITGPFGYVLKPFKARELHTTIQMVLYKHQMDKKLQESELKHRILFEEALNPIMMIDQNGRYLDANRAALEFLEHERDELVGKVIWDFVLPDQLKRQQEEHTPFVSGRTVETDYLVNGVIKTLLLNITPVTAADQTFLYCIGQDITRHKRSQERLEAIYRLGRELTLLHNETDIAQRGLNVAANILRSERAGYALVNEISGELEFCYYLINGVLGAVRPPLPLDGAQGVGVAVVRRGQLLNIADTGQDPRYVAWPDGWTAGSELCAPMKVRDQIIGVMNVESLETNHFTSDDEQLLQTLADQVAVALENAHLFQAERARYKEAEALHRTALALTSTTELDQVIDRILQELQTVVPYDSASIQLLQGDCTKIIGGRGFPNLPEVLGLTYSLDGTTPNTLVVASQAPLIVGDVRAAYASFFVEEPQAAAKIRSWLGVPLLIGKQIIGMLTLDKQQVDFYTEDHARLASAYAAQAAIAVENARLFQAEQEQYRRLQQSQAQLIQVEKMAALGRLVASIAHEINNPIQSIQNALTLTEEELAEGGDLEELNLLIGVARNEIDRIATIICRMRDFYRPSRREPRIQIADSDSIDDFYRLSHTELQTVDVQAILGNVLQLANKQLQHSRVKVEYSWTEDLPPIQGSADHLKQVFLNLVLNAIDAMGGESGTLYIRTVLEAPALYDDQLGPMVRVEFRDTGKGMPPEIVSRIFEPLFTTKEQGTGFGLFTSYKIVEAHRGQITAESQIGGGTTFTILLPVEQRERRS
jgi:PAS domain S-box-containing protein